MPYISKIHHIFNETGKRMSIDELRQGPDSKIWDQSLSNEWGRLAQGNDNNVPYTDTIEFIYKHDVPPKRDITYAQFVLDYRPLKPDKYRTRITVGGDKLTYPYDAGSPTTDLLESKILINSTISDAKIGARFCSADIRDMFLASPMERPEYMKVLYKHFPEDIRQRYNLQDKLHKDGYIYKLRRACMGSTKPHC